VHPYWRMLEHGTGATEPLRGPELHGGEPVLVASRTTPQRPYTSAPKAASGGGKGGGAKAGAAKAPGGGPPRRVRRR
jgi:hypothetical protein